VNLPTIEEVEQLWDDYHVPQNVRGHMKAVAKVAVFLAKKLKEKGIHVDVGLVERSALLHDLLRAANFENFDMQKDADADDIEFWKQLKHKYGNMHHGEAAAGILKEKYPEIAEAVAGHTIDNVKDNLLEAPWAAKIIAYSDSRVIHDRIVSLDERKEDSRKRHGQFYAHLKEESGVDYFEIIYSNTRKVEEEIFNIIDEKPEDVSNID
jgi:putative nucleotidyltransferase with HDIG domain